MVNELTRLVLVPRMHLLQFNRALLSSSGRSEGSQHLTVQSGFCRLRDTRIRSASDRLQAGHSNDTEGNADDLADHLRGLCDHLRNAHLRERWHRVLCALLSCASLLERGRLH